MIHSECLLKVGVLGLNHKTADLALREGVARGANALFGKRALFFPHPTVLLSTCNRTEIYFSSENLSLAHTHLIAFLRSVIEGSFEHRLYSYFHAECFAHLCRVTAGLDSAILAETEIQRQVKVAYAKAAEHLALPSSVHYVFQKALKVAKTLRRHLEVELGAPTLYTTLYEIAENFWGSLKERKILLIGYSEIQRGLASFLLRKGVEKFALCTTHPERVVLEGAHVFGRSILEKWKEFDWIICASKAERALIRGKSSQRQLIFDLSVPRNVDPEVGENHSVTLMNIEQINQVIEERRRIQGDSIAQCEELLWENVVRLSRIYKSKLQFPHERSPAVWNAGCSRVD